MMAVGFSSKYIRLVNLTSSRVGFKFSEIMAMQLGEPVVFIPCRDMVLEPIKKAYAYTLENPLLDLLGQATDLYGDNVRMLGIVYNVAENTVRMIYSRAKEDAIAAGKIPDIDVIRYMDFELTDYERFTYTFMTMNRWNFCNVRQVLDINRVEFDEMFKCSASAFNGSVQCEIDLEAFKVASVTKDASAQICKGVMTEEQLFYDLDVDSSLQLYARVSSENCDDTIPEMILQEYLHTVPLVHPKSTEFKNYKLELKV